ncbi:hypothetical protein QQF64_034913 [Cirrhinus molitorella]|uniref:Uncharacterized protein n=1 Tax=Cirrhinus molitorella TaxID=172907 RepID=A0ABR3NF44_9TELE
MEDSGEANLPEFPETTPTQLPPGGEKPFSEKVDCRGLCYTSELSQVRTARSLYATLNSKEEMVASCDIRRRRRSP